MEAFQVLKSYKLHQIVQKYPSYPFKMGLCKEKKCLLINALLQNPEIAIIK